MASVTNVISVLLILGASVNARYNDLAVDINTVAEVSNRLGDKLQDTLGSKNGNYFYSPTSISTALSALYVGSRGTTRQELGRIGYDEFENAGTSSVADAYRNLLRVLESRSDEYVLEIANALISQKEYPILEEYKDTLETSYKALLKEVDFVQDREEAVKEVNSWVSEQTHGKIIKLVDDVDPSTRLLLLNAIYFKGTWKTEFDPINTRPRPFYNNGNNSPKNIPTMKIKSKYPFLYDEERQLRAIQLPYKGDDISMVILLPEERDGVRRLQDEVSYNTLNYIVEHLAEQQVTVSLPKFKLEYSRSLKQDLHSIGIRSAFGYNADLSGITGTKDLYVSDVMHKAVVEINEEGSEAAGVTGVIITTKMMRPVIDFKVDHPFLFYLIDNRTKTNLFVGRVNQL